MLMSKTCLDSSAVAFLDSSAGVSLDSSAASYVSQSAGARFAPSCKGQRRGLSRLAVRPVFDISMRQSRIQSSELSAKNKRTVPPKKKKNAPRPQKKKKKKKKKKS